MYVVKKAAKNQYQIYRYEVAGGQLMPVGQTKEEPQGFTDGKVHLVRKVKLPREQPFWGHYLLPLGQAAVPTDFKLLKVVEVDQ
jgi:hypothetical protein